MNEKRLEHTFITIHYEITKFDGSKNYLVYNEGRWVRVFNSLLGAKKYIAKKLNVTSYKDLKFTLETRELI